MLSASRPVARRLARAAALALAVALLVASRAATAEDVVARAWDHGGFGRMVFDWKTPVAHRLEGREGALAVVFARPMEGSLAPILRQLPRYVAQARLEDGGTRAVFALAPGVSPSSFAEGNSVVVDLRRPEPDDSASGPPIGQSSPDVRVGSHEGFSRLVFEWKAPVGYKLVQDGATARIDFDRAAGLDVESLRARLPPFVTGVALASGRPGLSLEVQATPGVRFRVFRAETKVVLDVLRPPPRKDMAEEDVAGALAALAGIAPAAGGAPASSERARRNEAPKKPVPARAKTAVAALEAAPAPSASSVPASAGPPTRLLPPAAEAASPAAPAPEPTPPATPAAKAASSAAAGPQPPPSRAPASAAAAAKTGASVQITVRKEKGATLLRFDWAEPAAAAVYRRAGSLWIAFDRKAEIDLSGLKAASPEVSAAGQVALADATLVRLSLAPGLHPAVTRDGAAWVLRLQRQPSRPAIALAPRSEPAAASQARIVVPVAEPGRELRVKDPEVGDNLVILPLMSAGQGLPGDHAYALFRLLASAQGLVIEGRADDLAIERVEAGIAIAGGTASSASSAPPAPEPPAAQEAAAPEPDNSASPYFDFAAWRQDDLPFESTRQLLQGAIVRAEPGARNAARLDLARFVLARGAAVEALGLLAVMAGENPQVAADPAFLAVRGTALYLAGNYAGAAADLASPALMGDPEAALWRAALAAATGNWGEAGRGFAAAGHRIQAYPPAFRNAFLLLAAEAALNAGDTESASLYLGLVGETEKDAGVRGKAAYLEGRLAQAANEVEKAAELYQAAIASGNAAIAAKARFARVDLLVEAEKMTLEEAIGELERLSSSWRGDSFEFDVLRRLGSLYLAAGTYEKGLATLKRALALFPDNPKSREAAEEMSRAFAELYLGHKADRMPPLKALAIFQEFRELTPPGEQGDAVIRELAERLVAVDLLDQAAELLEAQVAFRLQGMDKAAVGSRLAAIRLMDQAPEKALAALEASQAPGLPDYLVADRRRLKARALAALGRTDDALAELEGDDSQGAERLRADIFWNERRWAEAAGALSRLVPAEVAAETKLDPGQSLLALKLAAALWLADDRGGLEALRTKLGPAMEGTAYGGDFAVIAAAPAEGLSSVEAIAARLSEVGLLEGFVKEIAKSPAQRAAASSAPPAAAAAPTAARQAAAN